MERKNKIKLKKGEKLIYFVLILMIVSAPILVVFSKSMLSKTNIELSNLQRKIDKQASTNQSLGMKINELASLEKIQNLANDLGLSYNNDNIKVISEK